jgi:hypothetical protein
MAGKRKLVETVGYILGFSIEHGIVEVVPRDHFQQVAGSAWRGWIRNITTVAIAGASSIYFIWRIPIKRVSDFVTMPDRMEGRGWHARHLGGPSFGVTQITGMRAN